MQATCRIGALHEISKLIDVNQYHQSTAANGMPRKGHNGSRTVVFWFNAPLACITNSLQVNRASIIQKPLTIEGLTL